MERGFPAAGKDSILDTACNRTMNYPTRRSLFNPAFTTAVLVLFILTASGCGYMSFYTRQSTWRAAFQNKPRMSLLQRFAPQDSLLLNGKIVKLDQREGPLLLMAVTSQYRENEIVARTTIRDPLEEYTLFLPKGDYGLFVFADLNGNGIFERNELVGEASILVQPASGNNSGTVEGPPITVNYKEPGKTVFRVRVKMQAVNYAYSSLDDEFFDPRFGNAGLYNPAALMSHTQGFVFGLEEYDEKKTMVLFVHGIGGTPRDWKYFTEGLDRSRFQPFFLYYPSGMPLDKLGSLLAQVIDSLDKSFGNNHLRIVLAGHSMGGLVSLSAINKLAVDGLPSSLKMYCSFSTPYAGNEAARKGVENAPYVVPVWHDIAVDSEFLRQITAQPFPSSLPFYLFFTYNDTSTFKQGEASDGTITLRSQLDPALQSAAVKVFGFNETHESFLTSEAAREKFLQLIDKVSPPKSIRPNKQ